MSAPPLLYIPDTMGAAERVLRDAVTSWVNGEPVGRRRRRAMRALDEVTRELAQLRAMVEQDRFMDWRQAANNVLERLEIAEARVQELELGQSE